MIDAVTTNQNMWHRLFLEIKLNGIKMQKVAELITKKNRSSRACSRREIKSDKKESKKESARKQT